MRDQLRPHAPGLYLALVAIVFGWGMGIAFGVAEESIKGVLKADGEAALATVYEGDTAAMQKIVDKSWIYMKRAHLHAGVLGATSIALILLLAALGSTGKLGRIASPLLGGGAFLYGLFWMLAGFKAPGLGSTGKAKEALEWIAIPGSGALVIGLVLTIVCTVLALRSAPASQT